MYNSTIQCSVLCFVFSSHLFWTSCSLDVPAGVTQEKGHTGFLIYLPSAVRALIFLAKRIQVSHSFPSSTVKSNFFVFSTCWAFFFFFIERNTVYRGSNSRPNVSEGYEVTSELQGRPAIRTIIAIIHTSRSPR